MAFSTMISFMVLFMFLLTVLVGVFLISREMTIENRNAISSHQQMLVNQLQSQIVIQNVTYSGGLNRLTVVVENTGKQTLKTDLVDVYVMNDRIPRNTANRSIAVKAPDIKNPLLWDSDEQTELNITYPLSSGNYTVEVRTEHGTGDSALFEVT
ncbi:hypothetical protein C4573_00035 [Candidatus Woesearchaeota archaeon]|nr:MAG: hypothetical protein C4573_00035 [Candidatus Woesearchaeota archaeon]